jgi:class 3 adenylate cyclase
MGVDEEGTLTALKAYRSELIDPEIAEQHGRIVKMTGDGALIEFANAVDAVRCSMEIERAMAERNPDRPEDRRIEFRIGINVGDIIIDEGDIYGDGENIDRMSLNVKAARCPPQSDHDPTLIDPITS